jgi:Holliday junction resolvase RusA-like endonuclease
VSAILYFVVPGKPCSNNRKTRNYRTGATKSEAARLYETRVASIATAAAMKARWTFPECCRVQLVHWNGRLDADNGFKCALDAMRGIVFFDDSKRYVRGVRIELDNDGGEERIEVTVTRCEAIPIPVLRVCSRCLIRHRCVAISVGVFRCALCAAKERVLSSAVQALRESVA